MEPNKEMLSMIISDNEKTEDAPMMEERGDFITQPRVNFQGVNTARTRVKKSHIVTRPRWTLVEDCKLFDTVANHRGEFVWSKIARDLPRRDGNGCRLRWVKLSRYNDTHSKIRWSQIINLKGDGAIDQWRYMISHYNHYLFARLPDNHPLKRPTERIEGTGSSGQPVDPIITDSSIHGGDENDVGETSMVTETPTPSLTSEMFAGVDLSLRLAINHNEIQSPALQLRPRHPFHDFLAAKYN